MGESSVSAEEVARRLLPAITSGDVHAVVELCSSDVVFEFPFAPVDRPRRIGGKAAVQDYLLALAAPGHAREVRDLHLHRTADTHVVIAEWSLLDSSAEAIRSTQQAFVVVLTVQDGLIERYRDYWGPRLPLDESVSS